MTADILYAIILLGGSQNQTVFKHKKCK